jgi:hypothetical protein
MSFVFYIKPVDEKLSREMLAGIFTIVGLTDLESDQDDTSIAALEFAMKIVGEPDIEDLDFDKYIVQFRTRKNRQLLIIDTEHMNEGVEPGRFKIRRVWADVPGKPHAQDAHVKRTDNSFRSPGFDGAINEDVKQVVLDFKMPGNKKTELFEFYLTIEDTMSKPGVRNVKECDPQVGNDPP